MGPRRRLGCVLLAAVLGTTAACAVSIRSICADLVAGGFTVAVSAGAGAAVGCLDLVRDEATSVSCVPGETGRCRAKTRRPLRLLPRMPFQRRSICGETPKFSATVSTVSPL